MAWFKGGLQCGLGVDIALENLKRGVRRDIFISLKWIVLRRNRGRYEAEAEALSGAILIGLHRLHQRKHA